MLSLLRCLGIRLTAWIHRAAADVLYEVMTIMVKKGPLSIGQEHEL